MKKTIIKVKAYLLEEPPEGPRRDEKNNYLGKCLPPRRAPGGPPEGWKKTIILVNDYLLEEPPEGPRRDEKNQLLENGCVHTESPRRDEKTIIMFNTPPLTLTCLRQTIDLH